MTFYLFTVYNRNLAFQLPQKYLHFLCIASSKPPASIRNVPFWNCSFQRNSRERYLKMSELDVTGDDNADLSADDTVASSEFSSLSSSALFEYNIKGLQPQTKWVPPFSETVLIQTIGFFRVIRGFCCVLQVHDPGPDEERGGMESRVGAICIFHIPHR